MRLRLTPRANGDLVEIADYIRPRSPQSARRVRSAILASLQAITQFPRVGRSQTTEGVRKVVVRKYPYLIYYIADDGAEEVVVLTIQHAARQRQFTDA